MREITFTRFPKGKGPEMLVYKNAVYTKVTGRSNPDPTVYGDRTYETTYREHTGHITPYMLTVAGIVTIR